MIAAILLPALVAQALPGAKPDAFDLAMQGKSAAAVQVAEAMEKGFRTCARQVGDRTHLSAANDAELGKEGVTLRTTPPAEVGVAAATLFKADPVYAEVETQKGNVWIAASPTIPACKVIVADTPDMLAARTELGRRFAAAKAWSPDAAQSFDKDGVVRQAYIRNPDQPGAHMVTFVDGPAEIADGGKGIQAIVTVGVMKPKED